MKDLQKKQYSGMSPCAACKLLRRRCVKDCVFAPYFPADEPLKFANVHKIFGASNINKMLKELPEEQRGDAVRSMVYEANARVGDPVYGCVGAISCLQQQLTRLRAELAEAKAEIYRLRSQENVFIHEVEGCALKLCSNSSQGCNCFHHNQGSDIAGLNNMEGQPEYLCCIMPQSDSNSNSNVFQKWFL